MYLTSINEWFGVYNMIFRHIKESFGEDELQNYLGYLGDVAYDDISAEYKKYGLSKIRERYMSNFNKDGGKVFSDIDGHILNICVEICPAYKYMLESSNPYDKPEDYYCECCIKINTKILSNAGFKLSIIDCSRNGRCKWSIRKRCLKNYEK